MGQVLLEGFLLQASLIFALGAQNLFVLESGLRRRYPITISFVCFLCDLTIITIGVLTTATLLTQYPAVKIIFGIMGAAFLIYYGFNKIAVKEQDLLLNGIQDQRKGTLKHCVLSAIAFSVINPHAYLDGLILIGGYSSKFSELSERLLFGLGAGVCSLVWFLILSGASYSLLPVLSNPRRMRLALSASGIILVCLSFKLSLDVYGWVTEILDQEAIVMQK